MKKNQKGASLVLDDLNTQLGVTRSPALGAFAHGVIGEQFRRIVKQERNVLADQDPEPLHQMRVAIRRLRTAIQVFDQAVELPKAASDRRLRDMARVLGRLRDLDVQIATLREDYQPQLNKTEQGLLNNGLAILQKQRRKAFAGSESLLTHAPYQDLKATYERWLDQPQFKPLAQLPLFPLLPDILSPLLSTLLLHPGWLIPLNQLSLENAPVLHDLRKLCKQVRYQAEFFVSFYGEPFQAWIDEVKELQDNLGQVQDGHVLLDLLVNELPNQAEMPELQATIHQKQDAALSNWETIRQKYLSPKFRYQLHRLLLNLSGTDNLSANEATDEISPGLSES